MPKKKPTAQTKPDDRKGVNLRFNEEEKAMLAKDLKSMPGIPVSLGAYAKHAVLSYPKLRKLEALLVEGAKDAMEHGGSADSESIYARDVLKEAGL